MWLGWYIIGSFLFIISLFIHDSIVADKKYKRELQEEEACFARLYPEDYAERKKEEENELIELKRKWAEQEKEEKEAKKLANLKEAERKRQEIRKYENWYFNK